MDKPNSMKLPMILWIAEEYENFNGAYKTKKEALENAWAQDSDNVFQVVEKSAFDSANTRIAELEDDAMALNDTIDNLTTLANDLRNESQTEGLRALRMVDAHKINELEKAVAMWKDRSEALVEALEKFETEEFYLYGEVKKDGSRMVRDLWWIRNQAREAIDSFRKAKIGKPE